MKKELTNLIEELTVKLPVMDELKGYEIFEEASIPLMAINSNDSYLYFNTKELEGMEDAKIRYLLLSMALMAKGKYLDRRKDKETSVWNIASCIDIELQINEILENIDSTINLEKIPGSMNFPEFENQTAEEIYYNLMDEEGCNKHNFELPKELVEAIDKIKNPSIEFEEVLESELELPEELKKLKFNEVI